MKEEIKRELANLHGLEMWTARRSVDLLSFHFGGPHETLDHKGNKALVGEYALHVQCPWRITNSSAIIVASGDRFYPAGNSTELVGNFEWDRPGANQCDKRISAFFAKNSNGSLIVEGFVADEVGSITLIFKGRDKLEIFPANSFDTEHWRLFRPYLADAVEERHFVVTDKGIEKD